MIVHAEIIGSIYELILLKTIEMTEDNDEKTQEKVKKMNSVSKEKNKAINLLIVVLFTYLNFYLGRLNTLSIQSDAEQELIYINLKLYFFAGILFISSIGLIFNSKSIVIKVLLSKY